MQALIVVLVEALMKYTSPVVESGANSLFQVAPHSGGYPDTGMPPADIYAVQPCLVDSILLTRERRHLQHFWVNAMVICVNTLAALTLVHLRPGAKHRLEDPLPDVVPYYAMLGEPTLPSGYMVLDYALRT